MAGLVPIKLPTMSRGFTPRRWCAVCDKKIKPKERLCPEHLEEYKDSLTEPWLCAIIQETVYEYNVSRRDIRNGVVSLEKVLGKI